MSSRELVVLGTASQVPTRTRNHNGYLLRWDEEGLLFDPGEGTQRQLLLAGVPASAVTRICITHAHGDHCLGLPGVLQRLALDGVPRPVDLCYPRPGAPYVDALRIVGEHRDTPRLVTHEVDGAGPVLAGRTFRLLARPLEHRIPTVGWRLEEPDGRRMLSERLAAYGVAGPDVGRLQREGALDIDGRRVRLEDVSAPRRGQRFAFVMDTRLCEAAFTLAEGADLLVCESTYLSRDASLAREYGHLTAAQAATVARDAGARRLVLSHFSRRYGEDVEPFLVEARAVHEDVVAARDLDRVPLPTRRSALDTATGCPPPR